MKKLPGALIYEGKAKKVFATDHPDQVLVKFKNDATAFNAAKHEVLEGKGELNCKISTFIFKLLQEEKIPTHFISQHEDIWMLVQRVDVIPLEIVVRNIASGSLCRETPIKEGTELPFPLCEFYYKNDQLGDPLLTDDRLKILKLITDEEQLKIKELALQVNNFLKSLFKKIDLTLVDFKLEMGFNNSGDLLIADEFSPDNCRLWDQKTNDQNDRILDKDRFRNDLGGVVEAYGEILKRIKEISANPRIYK